MDVAPLPELTAARAFTTWALDPWAAGLAVLLAVGYLVAVRHVRATGGTWPLARTLWFLLAGVGTLVVATSSSLAVYRQVLFWPPAVANTVLGVVAPVGLALGDPVGLAELASPPAWGRRLRAARQGPLARVLTFPLVSALLGALTQLAVYFTPYFRASLRSTAVHELLGLHLLVVGVLFAVPLLGEDLLPGWATHPVRAAITFLDGLFDAVPGMLLALISTPVAQGWYLEHPRSWGPTPAFDQSVGGALVFCVTEAVGAPLLLAVFVQWSRADAGVAAAEDRRLDLAEADAPSPAASAGPASSAPPSTGRPWWETDPGPLRGRRYDQRPDPHPPR